MKEIRIAIPDQYVDDVDEGKGDRTWLEATLEDIGDVPPEEARSL